MNEILYCVYNTKKIETPVLIEINDFKKNGNEYSFEKHEHGYLNKIKLGKDNIFIDYGLSMGDSPLEWIYIYTTDKNLALTIFEEECIDIGAGMYGGKYREFMERRSKNNT